MTAYERTHGGRTPAEDGESAAREDQAFRKAFLAKLKDPQVKKAARQAVQAIAILEEFGLKVIDWSATGSRIEEIEVEDTLRREKGWIKVSVLQAAKPALKDIDGETAQILEIERELRRGPRYRPEIEARRQNGIG